MRRTTQRRLTGTAAQDRERKGFDRRVDRIAGTLGTLSLPIARRRTTMARLMEKVLVLVAKLVGELPHHLHGSRQSCLIDAQGCHGHVGPRQASGDDNQ